VAPAFTQQAVSAKQGDATSDGGGLATLEFFVFGGSKKQHSKIAIA
jgi:hypothetical protein